LRTRIIHINQDLIEVIGQAMLKRLEADVDGPTSHQSKVGHVGHNAGSAFGAG
jgi:hypothetical protein